MKNAVIAVLIGALSGIALAGNITNDADAPKGYVTIQEVPVVVVEAKRWSPADEAAYNSAKVAVVKADSNLMRRFIAYVGR